MPFDLDDLPPLRELILGGPVPFLVAFALLALLGRSRPSLAAGLGLLTGYWILHVELNGALYPGRYPSLAAVRVEHWLFVIPALGALCAYGAGSDRAALRLGLPVSLCLGILVLCFYPKLKGSWSPLETLGWMALWTAAGNLAWHSAQRGAERAGSFPALCLGGAAVGLSSLVIGLSGSRKLAQMSGALAAATLGLCLHTLLEARRAASSAHSAPAEAAAQAGAARGALGPLLAGHLALLVLGVHYNELGLDQALLCLAPWPLAWAGPRPGPRWNSPGTLLHVALALLPTLAALGLALARFTPAEEPEW